MTRFKVYGQEVNMGDRLPPIPRSDEELDLPEVIDDGVDSKKGIFSKLPRAARIGAKALAPAVILTPVAFIVAGCESNVPLPTTTVEAPDTTDTSVEQSGEVTIESLKIDPELMNDPEKLARTFVDRLNEWQMSGATYDNLFDAMTATDENVALADLASSSDDVYRGALVTEQPNGVVSEWVETAERMHLTNLGFAARTLPNFQPEDIESYVREDVLLSVDKIDILGDGKIVVYVTLQPKDNSEKNRVGKGENYTYNGEGLDTDPYKVGFVFDLDEALGGIVLVDVIYLQ